MTSAGVPSRPAPRSPELTRLVTPNRHGVTTDLSSGGSAYFDFLAAAAGLASTDSACIRYVIVTLSPT